MYNGCLNCSMEELGFGKGVFINLFIIISANILKQSVLYVQYDKHSSLSVTSYWLIMRPSCNDWLRSTLILK